MTPDLASMISSEADRHARRYHRRWPGVPLDDLVQQGWVVALETLARRPDLGPEDGSYVGRAIVLALGSHVYQVTCPVHLPSKKESTVAGPGRAVQILGCVPSDHVDEPVQPQPAREIGRALVVAVTAGYPWARPVLLETRTELDQGPRCPGGQYRLTHEVRVAKRTASRAVQVRVAILTPDLVRLTTECPQVRGLLLGRRTLAQVLSGPVDPWVVARVLTACLGAL